MPIMLPATSIVACVSDILRPGALTCVASPCSAPCLAQALHVVDAVAILDAVRVVAEAGEALVPRRQRAQVAEIRTVVGAGRLARHEHRNAGRVGHDAGREHAIGELLERHVLDLVAHQVLIRGVRRHDRRRQRRERLGEPVRLPRFAQLREHLVGEIAQPEAAVDGRMIRS